MRDKRTVFITVMQDGSSATYTDDGGATFTGTVCGNIFRFSGGAPGYAESGAITLGTGGLAIKRVTYRETFLPFCTGDCLDSLYRAGPGISATR